MIEKRPLGNSDETKELNIYNSAVNQFLEVVI